MNERDVVCKSRRVEGLVLKCDVLQVTRGIHTDCLLNYETVKYFNGEQHESDRYDDAIRGYQTVEYKVIGTKCST